MPNAKPHCFRGRALPAIANPMGTVAPPPTACITLAPTIHSRLDETATKLVPTQKTTNEA